MLGLAVHLAVPDVAVIAPEAASRSWWPGSFLAPLATNQPGLSSGVSMVSGLIDALVNDGVAAGDILLGGFSQGACLAVETAARHPVGFRAVAALSGGLVGNGDGTGVGSPDLYGHADKTFDYSGRLDDVPVLLGVHERDPHIPLARVRRSATILGAMGAQVEMQVVPGAGHGIFAEEAAWLRSRLNISADTNSER